MFATVERYGKLVGLSFQLSGDLARRLSRLRRVLQSERRACPVHFVRLFNSLRSPKPERVRALRRFATLLQFWVGFYRFV